MIPYITNDQVQSFSSFGSMLITTVAAWQAFKGLRSWQSEKVGSRKIELAEDALTKVYEIQTIIGFIRSPFGYANEVAERDVPAGESPAQKYLAEMGFRAFFRMRQYHEVIDSFRVYSLKMKAVFGRDLYAQFDVINDCIHSIRVSADMLLTAPHDGYTDEDLLASLKADVMYQGERRAQNPESIEFKLNSSVELIEEALIKILNPK